jgi:hypothetical protein
VNEAFDLERIKEMVRARLSEKAALHCERVADTAAALANVYGADPYLARLAGLLHDWDRERKGPDLVRTAEEDGLEVTEADRLVPYLLHAKTGAVRLSLATGVPIIPMGSWGSHPVWQKSGKGSLRFGRPIWVKVGPPIDLSGRTAEANDRDALHGSGRGPGHRLGKRRRPSLRDDYRSPDGVGDPQDRAEGLGILDLVEQEQEPPPRRSLESPLRREIGPHRGSRHRTLVRRGSGRAVERPAIAVSDLDPVLPAEALESVDPPVAALRVEQDPFDLARPGSDRLLDGMEAGEDHPICDW